MGSARARGAPGSLWLRTRAKPLLRVPREQTQDQRRRLGGKCLREGQRLLDDVFHHGVVVVVAEGSLAAEQLVNQDALLRAGTRRSVRQARAGAISGADQSGRTVRPRLCARTRPHQSTALSCSKPVLSAATTTSGAMYLRRVRPCSAASMVGAPSRQAARAQRGAPPRAAEELDRS